MTISDTAPWLFSAEYPGTIAARMHSMGSFRFGTRLPSSFSSLFIARPLLGAESNHPLASRIGKQFDFIPHCPPRGPEGAGRRWRWRRSPDVTRARHGRLWPYRHRPLEGAFHGGQLVREKPWWCDRRGTMGGRVRAGGVNGKNELIVSPSCRIR